MQRKKQQRSSDLSKTINVRLPSILDSDIRALCKYHDLPVSHFGRRAFATYFGELKNKSSLFEESPR